MPKLFLAILTIHFFISSQHLSTAQDIDIDFALSGVFNDENGDGLAQAGETILFTATITNTGTQTLDSIEVFDINNFGSPDPKFIFGSKGPIYNLQVNMIDSTTYVCLYALSIYDILNGKVSYAARADVDYIDSGGSFPIPKTLHFHESVEVNYSSAAATPSNPMIETTEGDVYINEAKNGVILKSPSGNCFRVRVEDNGTLRSEPINCP